MLGNSFFRCDIAQDFRMSSLSKKGLTSCKITSNFHGLRVKVRV